MNSNKSSLCFCSELCFSICMYELTPLMNDVDWVISKVIPPWERLSSARINESFTKSIM